LPPFLVPHILYIPIRSLASPKVAWLNYSSGKGAVRQAIIIVALAEEFETRTLVDANISIYD